MSPATGVVVATVVILSFMIFLLLLSDGPVAATLAGEPEVSSLDASASDVMESDPFADETLWAPLASEVNRGEVEFLAPEAAAGVHHHYNEIVLAASSLEDGWVTLRQCHRDLDRVRRAQIVYNPETTLDIEIESQQNIGSSWVEGASVQLRQVAPDAELCVRARSQMLALLPDGSYRLDNGPFMRRFLDGYYPMRVTLAIQWGELGLSLRQIAPKAQAGFSVADSPDGLKIDATFAGRLETSIELVISQTGD